MKLNNWAKQNYEQRYGKEKANKIIKIRSEFMKSNKNPMKTEKGKINSRKSHLGKKLSLETRKKLSLAKKGKSPINLNYLMKKGEKTRFRKGIVPWNKGLKNCYSKEVIEKMGNSMKGTKHTEEWKCRMSKLHTGFKHSEESIKKMSGKNCHLWNGGISFEPYTFEFNKILKNKIRNRDNQICMNCNKHREKFKEAFAVHHINYDKKCNLIQNLISLCRNCHTLTNTNRPYWINLFQEKLSKLYNYKYSSDGKIILEVKQNV